MLDYNYLINQLLTLVNYLELFFNSYYCSTQPIDRYCTNLLFGNGSGLDHSFSNPLKGLRSLLVS